MIKAIGEKDGQPAIILGLSRRNCELLLEGKPIVVDVGKMGGPRCRVILMAAETEQHLIDDLENFALIKPGTPRHRQPGLEGNVTE